MKKKRQYGEEIDSKPKRCKPLRQASSSVVGLLLLNEEESEGSSSNYEIAVKALQNSTSKWDHFFSDSAADFRTAGWTELDNKIDLLCNRYAWAVPDDRALRIIKHFSPVIEIGAGKGYWAKLLRQREVDILAFDKFVFNISKTGSSTKRYQKCHSEVLEGGPEVLLGSQANDRTLLLCYPDDRESMAIVSLENFRGDIIIYIGEMIHTGTAMGAPVAPFGRTSSAEFQVALTEGFHCLLVCRLQTTYPNSRDCISVWKRTKFIQRVEATRLSDEADTTAPIEADGPPAPMLAENEVEFLSAADLAQLRMGSSSTATMLKNDLNNNGLKGRKKIGKSTIKNIFPVSSTLVDKEEDSVPASKSKEDIAALREIALDHQYNENNDTKWANIPDDEILPIDRAAPCLFHLLQ